MEQSAMRNLPALPCGWIVVSSKRYPDRVYYFNTLTGASTWEFPLLISSDVQTTKEECLAKDHNTSVKKICEMVSFEKNVERFNSSKDKVKKRSLELSCDDRITKKSKKDDTEQKSSCSLQPPTAVVNPVVKKLFAKNELMPVSSVAVMNSRPEPVNFSKRNKRKRKRLREAEKKALLHSSQNDISANKATFQTSKLNQPQGSLNKVQKGAESNLSSTSTNSCAVTSEVDSGFIDDIEMLDVSEDLTKIEDILPSDEASSEGFASYYIVVDTNVFIGDLKFIDEIKDTPIEGCGPPHIFIPWVVIQELDTLKKSAKVASGRKAIEAVRYLNSVLMAKHPRFHGQSAKEFEEWSQSYSKCNDDRILECCTSLAEKMPREKVILLTNDKNLANKALVCDIVVHTFESMMKELKTDVIYKGVTQKKLNSQRKAVIKGSNILVSLVPGKEGNSQSQLSQESNHAEKTAKKKLRRKQEEYKREIHSHMSTARQLLKDALEPFLEVEMNEAYGEPWKAFDIERKLLKGILGAVTKYWRTVFVFNFSEKDKRNFALLHEKVSRPEGFFGDREDCLSILTAIEDVFCQIKRRWPSIAVSVEKIQDIRAICADLFQKKKEIENSISATELQSSLNAFEYNWIVMNRLCGMIMDFCHIPHDFQYEKPDVLPPESDFYRLMCNLYPVVQQLKQLMSHMVEAVQKSTPAKKIFIKLHKALKDFIPSLEIQTDFPALPHFTSEALRNFCLSPKNREMIEIGYKQLENFHSKLHEALGIMMASKQKRAFETMQCD